MNIADNYVKNIFIYRKMFYFDQDQLVATRP